MTKVSILRIIATLVKEFIHILEVNPSPFSVAKGLRQPEVNLFSLLTFRYQKSFGILGIVDREISIPFSGLLR